MAQTQSSSIARFRKQLKIASAKPEDDSPRERKRNPFFSLVDHMGGDKRSWELLSEEERESINQWVILRWLSTYEEYLPIFSFISTLELSDKDFYDLMCCTLKRQKHYFNSPIYKKADLVEDEVLLGCIMKELFYTKEKAREYAKDIDPEEAAWMKNRWSDIVEEELSSSKKRDK